MSLLMKKSECCMTIATPVTADTPVNSELATPVAEKPANVKEVLSFLTANFPLCFISEGPVKPLKVGIFQDLAARLGEDAAVSKTQLRQALRVYTSSWRYLEATKEGASRVDLDGQPAELIDAQQAEHAAKLLAESKQKAAEKRKIRQQEQKALAAKTAQAERSPGAAKPVRSEQKRPNKNPKAASKSVKAPVKAVQSPVVKPAAAAVELAALAPQHTVVGAKVLVKLGSSPMPATVTEVNLPDVTVQLNSGMVIKTRQDSLFQA
ncbi:UNVERIFIED_CONTAM: proQ [Trichonephila clavipes]